MILSLLYEVDVPTCYRDPLWTKGNAGFVARRLKTREIREDRIDVIIKTGPVLVANPADFIDGIWYPSSPRSSSDRPTISAFARGRQFPVNREPVCTKLSIPPVCPRADRHSIQGYMLNVCAAMLTLEPRSLFLH